MVVGKGVLEEDMLSYRIMSSILLASALIASLLVKGIAGKIIFIAFAAAVAFLSVAEFSLLLSKIGIGRRSLFVEIFAVMLVCANLILCKNNKEAVYLTTILSSVFAVSCYLQLLISKDPSKALKQIINSMVSFSLAVIPLNFINFIYLMGDGLDNMGKSYVLFLIAVTKSGDIGGYVVGVLSSKSIKGGNHKIVPSISPNKSWEGTVGGMIFSVVVGYWLGQHLFKGCHGFEPLACLVIGSMLYIGGFLGDISESSLKRITGMKDSGKIIPGMGGILDVVDSLLLNAPMFYLYLSIMRF